MDSISYRYRMLYNTMLLIILLILPGSRYITSQEKEEGEPLEWRREWFYGQRMYPYNSIPSQAYINSINQKNKLIKKSANDYKSLGTWTSIGPNPFSGSCQVNPSPQLASGRVAALVYDPRDKPAYKTIWIAAANGGVWKTTDGGYSWVERNGSSNNPLENLPTLNSGAIAIDEERNIIYYGTGVNIFLDERYMGLGLFRSTNEGLTWESISNGLIQPTQIFKIAIDPRPGMKDHIFIADRSGLFETSNGGQSWKRVTQVLPPNPEIYGAYCTDVCFSPNNPTVYAIGPSKNFWQGSIFNGIGFWISNDYGLNFHEVQAVTNFPTSMRRGRSLLTVPRNANMSYDGLLYVMTYDNDNRNIHIYRTTNFGNNFVNIDSKNKWDLGGNAGYNQMIRCSDINPNVCFMGYQELYRTTNGADAPEDNVIWIKVAGSETDVHMDFHTLDFVPSVPSNEITVGDDGGIHKSSDLGVSWENKNSNLCLAQIFRFSSDVYNAEKIVAGLQDQGIGYRDIRPVPSMWRTTPSWEASCGDGSQAVSSPFRSGHFIAGTVVNQRIYYSTDGINFNPSDFYSPNFSSGNSITPIVNHPSQPGTAYTVRFNITSNGEDILYTPLYLLKSTDYGIMWKDLNQPFVRSFINPYPWGYNSLIAISQSKPDNIIIDVGNPSQWNHSNIRGFSRLLKSTNGGLNWLNEPNGSISSICKSGENGLPDRYITHVEFSPTSPDTIYLTVSGFNSGHVFRSVDGGFNWTNISYDLPDSPVNDLVIIQSGINEKQLWAASDVGVFYKEESSDTWIPVSPATLPNCPILDLDYNRFSGKLRASAFGRGIWEITLDGPIYVNDRLYITDFLSIDKDIIVCPGGELILGHENLFTTPITITIKNGHKITVMNEGKIYANGLSQVVIGSDSYWGGILIKKGGKINIDNINFQNTASPIIINPQDEASKQFDIVINKCVFNNQTLEIIRGSNIYIGNCVFHYSPGTAVIIAYGKNIIFENNVIIDSRIGISLFNSNVTCKYNRISNSGQGFTGINMHNCYSSVIKGNIITNFATGLNMLNCAPFMLKNNIVNSGASAVNSQSSFALLRPDYDGNGNTIWTGGRNVFTNSVYDISISKGMPDIFNGVNKFYGSQYYLYGSMHQIMAYHAENNCWDDGAPEMNKMYTDVYVSWGPYKCNPPDGASIKEELNEADKIVFTGEGTSETVPAQNIIFDLGNGHYDTVYITQGTINSLPDKMLLARGIKEELLGNYQGAVNLYKNLIQAYGNDISSVIAMNHILVCSDKQYSDTAVYTNLRKYYNSLKQNYSDTVFKKIAAELANKTYVRQLKYPEAITAYENEIINSSDSSEILNCELNIIELYMLIYAQGGDSINFTGRLVHLKPVNNEQAINMIYERMQISMEQKKIINAIPVVFALSQNFPNPFNPVTKINYAIPHEEKVTINVYDILGRVVKVLVNENQKAGYYTAVFDGSNYASGIYFYRITAGNFTSTKKMVLLK